MTLEAAANALDALARGRDPAKADVLAGALALQALVVRGTANLELVDAAAGLENIAAGTSLKLDEAGRARAAHLATKVRAAATTGLAN